MAKKTKNGKDFMLGVDLGGTKILAAVLNEEGKILARKKVSTKADRGPETVIKRIAKCAGAALEEAGIEADQVVALGIGSPGPLNSEKGIIENPVNLKGWNNVPLKAILEERLKIRTFVENDVTVGVYGEYRMGAGVGVRDQVGIFVGTGIGGGLILDGRLYQGVNGNAGEIGHMVVQLDGPVCKCGRRGCYEALAGRPALIRRIREIQEKEKAASVLFEIAGGDDAPVRSGHLARAWKESDPIVMRALREMAECTGVVVANLMNLLSCRLFILGGGVFAALGKELVPIVEKTALERVFPRVARGVQVRGALLGDDAGVVGAAFLARERAKAGPRSGTGA